MVLDAVLTDTCSGQTAPLVSLSRLRLAGDDLGFLAAAGSAERETPMGLGTERDRHRARGDEGAAVVEFALVMGLLFLLVYGIIQFGLTLSFKQDMTRAAAEGARAGAVVFPLAGQTFEEAAEIAAQTATQEAVEAFGGSFEDVGCTREGMTCNVSTPAPCIEDPNHMCITVELIYDYGADPLYGEIPLVGALMPDTIRAVSVARINE
jgi:hypothetical protein